MRARTESFTMNSYQKFKYLKESKVNKQTLNNEAIEAIKKITEEERLKNIIVNPELTHNINFEVPKVKKIPKSKEKKPIKFHEKARLTNFDMENVELIKAKKGNIVDFKKFCAMFNLSDEVNEVDIYKLLNIKLEKLNASKDKLQKIISFVSSSNENENIKNEIISELNKKLDEFKLIEENLNIISVNIDSINKISYNDNNTTVYFDNQK
jgi:hypothetical protein